MARAFKTRQGLTIIEMTIALAITAVIVGALSALSIATSRAWAATEQSTNTQLAGSRLSQQMHRHVRQAHWAGVVQAGSLDDSKPAAQVLLWRQDDWPVDVDDTGAIVSTGDGFMDFSEIALIEHDPASDQLLLYTVQFPPTYSPAQQQQMIDDLNESTPVPQDALTSKTFITTFKSKLKSLGLSARPLTPGVVDGAVFAIRGTEPGSTQRPCLEYVLRLVRSGGSGDVYSVGSRIEYGTITLRGAMRP